MTRVTIFLMLHAFVAAGTCLPSRYLAKLGGIHIQTQTDWRDFESTSLRWAQVP
jgi:hypothetical protein